VTRRRGLDIGIIVATLAAVRPGAAAAQPEVVTAPPAVHIVGPECRETPLSIAEFVDALRVELAGRGMRCCTTGAGADAAPAAAGELLVTLAVEPCDPNTPRVGVVVTDTRRLRAVERAVSLADLPPAARPRALALAVAELLHAADQPPQPQPPPAPAPPPEPQPPPATTADTVRLSGGADALLRSYPTRQTFLLGAQLSLGVSGTRWQAALAIDGALGRPSVDLGAVTIRTLAAAVTAGPRFAVGRATIDVGASASAGWAWVRGEPSVAGVIAGSGGGFIAAAGARVAVQAPSSSALRFHAAGEAGAVLHGVDAEVDGSAAAGIAGVYLSVAVGVRAP
jgi:hypothetical protein